MTTNPVTLLLERHTICALNSISPSLLDTLLENGTISQSQHQALATIQGCASAVVNMAEHGVTIDTQGPIEALKMSARTTNALRNENIVYICDILHQPDDYFLQLHSFGRVCLKELRATLKTHGLE